MQIRQTGLPARKCACRSQVSEHLLQAFADTRNESPIRVEHHEAELIVMEKAYDAPVGVQRDGRDFSQTHPRGGFPDLSQHHHRLRAQVSQIHARCRIGCADHLLAVRQNAGV